MPQYYRWHKSQLQHLLKMLQDKTLPHALLFTGSRGVGKFTLAKQFAQLLLCKSLTPTRDSEPESFTVGDRSEPQPCGNCHSCKLFAAGTHPDLNIVEAESAQGPITVDQVRELGAFFNLKSQVSDSQVAIIQPADKMNKYAANSLLKTLEEPTNNSYLILISHMPYRLLPTIRSRCQRMNFANPTHTETYTWLESQDLKLNRTEIDHLITLASGAPLTALEFAHNNILKLSVDFIADIEKILLKQQDPITIVNKYNNENFQLIIDWFRNLTFDLIRLKLGAAPVDISISDKNIVAKPVLDNLDVMVLYEFLDKLTEYARLLDSQINIQLSLEDLFIDWSLLQGRQSVCFPV